ncbi:MAG: metal-dependent hydrolase [Denitratisoma sp.]|nr:metal-dependent hydrolase [Denitratisoma sp.]
MFIGHFGIGFGAKAVAPRASLGTLFLAAQFIDLLWPTLLLLGVERVRIEPGTTAVTPLVFEHYPVSHSLLAVAAWALLLALAYRFLRQDRRGAWVVGLAVLSHWLLDAVVHQPDLPLYPGSAVLAGLTLWDSLTATLAVELPLFMAGVWFYLRATRPRDRVGTWGLGGLVGLLLAIYAGNLAGPPPPDVTAIAWVGQLQWLLVLWAYWVDAHRCNRSPAWTR